MKTLLLIALGHGLALLSAQAQWNPNPAQNLAVRDQAGVSERTPLAAPAPAGGTYVAWFESVAAAFQMRLQLLDANGRAQFGAAGLLVSNHPQSSGLYQYDLKTDHAGNAILAFQDIRTGILQAVAYKVSPTGQHLWGANGVLLLDAAASSGLAPTIGITTGNDVVVGWNSRGTASATRSAKWVSFQKYSPAGVALWPAVLRVDDPVKRYSRPNFIGTPGSDDVVMQYVEETGSGVGISTVYAQRYNAAGAPVWAAPTRVSDKTIGFGAFPEQVPDGSGGYYTLLGSGNPAQATLGDVFAQRVDLAGNLPWGASGTEVLTGTATARFVGSLQYVAARGEVWAMVNETNTSQSNSGITVQRLDPATGTRQLGGSGAVVRPVSASYYAGQTLRNTGTGLIITYTENTSPLNRALWATKVNYQGQSAFPNSSGHVLLSSVASEKLNFSTLPFANNQLVNVWTDRRQDDGIYAQTIGDNGALGVLASRAAQPVLALRLSPNPGRAPVAQFHLNRPQTITLLVRDLTGRLVHQQQHSLANGEVSASIDAPALAAGVYMVETLLKNEAWRGRWVKE